MLRCSGLFLLLLSVPLYSRTAADEPRVVYETEVEASVAAVWRAFTSNEGLQSWMAPVVEIDLKVGGKMRSNYNADGKLGDATTIENTILCYDPQRMLSLKATGFPEGFRFAEAAEATWSVFYFSALAESRTKITVVGLGYNDSEQSKQLRSFFATANEHSLNQLKAALRKQAEE